MRNHEIERLYIEQVRNIETAEYCFRMKETTFNRNLKQWQKKLTENEKEYKKVETEIIDPEKPTMADKIFGSVIEVLIDMFLATICSVIIGLILGFIVGAIVFLVNEFDGFRATFRTVLFVTVIIVELLGFWYSVDGIRDIFSEKKYEKKIEENKEKRILNAEKKTELDKNREEAIKHEENLLSNLQKIKTERKKIAEIKNSLYSVNWIPLQYRSIRVVYYICDMITTSEIGIDEALKYYLMQEANNKLDEIIERLDEIIDNQHQMIMNQAVIISQNKELISKNTKMINKLASIEDNTKLAADYAAIGVNYAEANAYISMATYLKK